MGNFDLFLVNSLEKSFKIPSVQLVTQSKKTFSFISHFFRSKIQNSPHVANIPIPFEKIRSINIHLNLCSWKKNFIHSFDSHSQSIYIDFSIYNKYSKYDFNILSWFLVCSSFYFPFFWKISISHQHFTFAGESEMKWKSGIFSLSDRIISLRIKRLFFLYFIYFWRVKKHRRAFCSDLCDNFLVHFFQDLWEIKWTCFWMK